MYGVGTVQLHTQVTAGLGRHGLGRYGVGTAQLHTQVTAGLGRHGLGRYGVETAQLRRLCVGERTHAHLKRWRSRALSSREYAHTRFPQQ
eukprot:366566-Chlamydomonas_euryale.AAC.3